MFNSTYIHYTREWVPPWRTQDANVWTCCGLDLPTPAGEACVYKYYTCTLGGRSRQCAQSCTILFIKTKIYYHSSLSYNSSSSFCREPELVVQIRKASTVGCNVSTRLGTLAYSQSMLILSLWVAIDNYTCICLLSDWRFMVAIGIKIVIVTVCALGLSRHMFSLPSNQVP